MKKAFPWIILGLLAITALVVKRCKRTPDSKKQTSKTTDDGVDRNNGLDRRLSFLEYTAHATCRMECLHIEKATIENSLEHWQIDTANSQFSAHPCPVYALEGYTSGKQHLRLIFAQCDYKTKLVTCVDIDSTRACQCAGAGSKYDQ